MTVRQVALGSVGAVVLVVVLVWFVLSVALFARFIGDLVGRRVDIHSEATRTVIVTPAGRERYLSVLRPYVQRLVQSGLAAEWQLWENTRTDGDAAFVQRLRSEHAWITVVPYGWTIRGKSKGATGDGREKPLVDSLLTEEFADEDKGSVLGVTRFLRRCTDADTLYVKMDDDLVWLGGPAVFRAFVSYVQSAPDNVLVSANVVNNIACEWLVERAHAGTPRAIDCLRLASAVLEPLGQRSGTHAEKQLREALPDPSLRAVQEVWRWPLSLSINCVAWKGNTLRSLQDTHHPMGQDWGYAGVTLGRSSDEEWLGVRCSLRQAEYHVFGSFVAVHFAFSRQEAHLLATDLLQRYTELANQVMQGLTNTSKTP